MRNPMMVRLCKVNSVLKDSHKFLKNRCIFCLCIVEVRPFIVSCCCSVKLIGKLQDGTVFVKKGYDEEPPFEFRVDEGNIFVLMRLVS